MMEHLFHDLRIGARSLTRSRGTTALSVACLALGIGMTSLVFSIVNGVLLRPLPFDQAERLVLVNETRREAGLRVSPTSYATYRDLAERGASLGEMAAVAPAGLSLADGGDPVHLPAAGVSGNLFRMLGVTAALGREIRPEDDRPGAEPVVVLSDALWRQRYAGEPSVLGRSLLVDGSPHTVVGVMPPEFDFPQNRRLWVPLAPRLHASARDERRLAVYARLAPGVAVEQAETRLGLIAAALAEEHPDTNRGWGVLARPLSALTSDRTRALLALMMGAVGLVLLIACADVANLMLARGVERQREFAIRAALGASRGRLRRQLLTESLLVGFASAPLGLGVAVAGLGWIERSVPDTVRGEAAGSLVLDGRVLAFTVGVAVATSLLFGLVPSLQAGRGSLRDALTRSGREATDGVGERRLKDGLVAAEVALSVVLLVAAGVFLRSFVTGIRADVGFEVEPLLSLRFDMPGEAYAQPDQRMRRVEDVVSRLRALPGVTEVSATDLEPLRGGGTRTTVRTEGAARPDAGEPGPSALYGGVTEGFFDTLGVPVLRGRSLDPVEVRSRSGVAVINETLAETLWPGEDPLGRHFHLDGVAQPGGFRVVGVARDVLSWDYSDRPVPSAFLPWSHVPVQTPRILMRVAGEPARFVAPARETVRAGDASLPVFEERTLEEVRALAFWRRRLLSGLFGTFGAFALLLAAAGAGGVLSYRVQRRTREIGVRRALGAGRADVIQLVVWQGMAPVAAGAAVGLLGALAVVRVMRGRLYELGGADPLAMAGVLALMLGVGIVSCYWPARRAVAVDPIAALRD